MNNHVHDEAKARGLIRGKGSLFWDRDGKRYVDYICGFGPIIVGHADDRINAAVCAQLERGILLPMESESVALLEKNLVARFAGMEMIHCVKTGSEAVAAAVRMARAHTGRSTIVRCGFFGWHDPMVSPDLDWHMQHDERRAPRSVAGLRPENEADMVWDGVDFGDHCAIADRARGTLAAILLDPVQITEPIGWNLRKIRDLATASGALLILDELKTGFRVGRAGVQGVHDIWADLVILGKGMANGFPLAAVLAPAWGRSLVKAARLKGTFNVEAASIAAALETLVILDREDAPASLNQLGCVLIERTNELLQEAGLDRLVRAAAYRWAAMPYLWFSPAAANTFKKPFYDRMASKGHLLLANHMNFVNLAHEVCDLRLTAAAIAETVEELATDQQLI